MKNLFLFMAFGVFLSGAAASAASLRCVVGNGQTQMVQLNGGRQLKEVSLELEPGLIARASRHPGYGMAFHNLGLELNGKSLGTATAWLPDDLGERNLSHFGALSILETVGERIVRCSYTILD